MVININLGIITISNIELTPLITLIKQLLFRKKYNSIAKAYIEKLRSRKSVPLKRRTIYNFDAE